MSLWSNIKSWIGKKWPTLKALYRPVLEVVKKEHRFAVMDVDDYREKFAFHISGMSLIVGFVVVCVSFIVLTFVIVAFTPLREYIPGYANADMIEQTSHNAVVIDSLENEIRCQEWMINNIQEVMSGKMMPSVDDVKKISDSLAALGVTTKEYTRSRADSLLRIYVRQNDINRDDDKSIAKMMAGDKTDGKTTDVYQSHAALRVVVPTADFISVPLVGSVISHFDVSQKQYGIDIIGMPKAVVSAASTGTIVSVSYSIENGYVVIVQHTGNVVTVYKNCDFMLKDEGDCVFQGEPIAMLGSSGNLVATPHLHFELWIAGYPADPEQFLFFK